MTDEEIRFVLDAIEQVAKNYSEWKNDYEYDESLNEYHHKHFIDSSAKTVDGWYREKLV